MSVPRMEVGKEYLLDLGLYPLLGMLGGGVLTAIAYWEKSSGVGFWFLLATAACATMIGALVVHYLWNRRFLEPTESGVVVIDRMGRLEARDGVATLRHPLVAGASLFASTEPVRRMGFGRQFKQSRDGRLALGHRRAFGVQPRLDSADGILMDTVGAIETIGQRRQLSNGAVLSNFGPYRFERLAIPAGTLSVGWSF